MRVLFSISIRISRRDCRLAQCEVYGGHFGGAAREATATAQGVGAAEVSDMRAQGWCVVVQRCGCEGAIASTMVAAVRGCASARMQGVRRVHDGHRERGVGPRWRRSDDGGFNCLYSRRAWCIYSPKNFLRLDLDDFRCGARSFEGQVENAWRASSYMW